MNFIEDTIFPHGSDSLGKECNIALKTSPKGSKTTFLPIKLQQSIIQAAMYAASGNNITTWLSISYIDSKAIILVENHLNRGKMGCFRSHIFSCLLIITVFLSPSCPPVRLRGTKLCPKHILDTYNLKNW